MEEYKKVRNSPEVSLKVWSYRDIYKVIAENTGLNMSMIPIIGVVNTYQLLQSQVHSNVFFIIVTEV